MTFVKRFAITFVLFLLLDSVWLGVISPRFYKAHIGFMLADPPVWGAALLFYLVFIAGLTFFAVEPGLRTASLGRAAARGGFFGFVTYATFDLTNQAVIAGWPWIVTIVDLAWGSFICAATTLASVLVGRRIARKA
ncbi:MAG TPA: DUF2177 family protein [Kiritimatiellia bacterium]|nr:DUF2177 family protein [Kiritimatiellia bacterium]HRZ13526.1 DUF2177 family protein [Kiritimatiellia bacterium]HSA19169.1 DUF2177 family protein [Kiritimatiellia bacterium]